MGRVFVNIARVINNLLKCVQVNCSTYSRVNNLGRIIQIVSIGNYFSGTERGLIVIKRFTKHGS